MSKNKLYSLLLIACFFGYGYLFYSFHTSQNKPFSMCFFKQVSGIPCPSCGNTRAIILLSEGKLYESLLLNPLGIAVAGIMTIFPIWVVMDLILQKASFYHFYKKSELIIKKRGVALFLIILVLLNWIWNITKHL